MSPQSRIGSPAFSKLSLEFSRETMPDGTSQHPDYRFLTLGIENRAMGMQPATPTTKSRHPHT
ncbi:hypothetical protein BVI434_1940049 [Burkholderia vietnamiensis]|nr:hypothetical protein BVI434_1940049 [Burkholderia vietnamiensis]